jgi:hypothetical protein
MKPQMGIGDGNAVGEMDKGRPNVRNINKSKSSMENNNQVMMGHNNIDRV